MVFDGLWIIIFGEVGSVEDVEDEAAAGVIALFHEIAGVEGDVSVDDVSHV